MRVEVQDLSEVEKILKIEIPQEKVSEVVDEVTRELRKNAKLKGFRKGKVPVYLVKKLFKEEIEERSVEKLIEKTLSEAIKEKELEPLLYPKLEEVGELKEGEPFSYSVLVEIRPEIELKKEDYIGIEVERDSDEVSEEEVETVIQELRYSFAKLEKVQDEPIEKRHVAVIRFVAYDGDKPVPGHQADALFIDVGTGEFNEKVEEALIGKKVGDRFSVEVEYPEEGLNPHLAGKKIRYDIEVKEVYKRELKELTDEFVKELNLGFNTVEELRESVKRRLEQEKKIKNDNALKERLLAKILEKVEIKVPKRYIDIKAQQLVEKIMESFEREGFNPELANITPERLRDRVYKLAETQAKEELLLEKIAELEGIEIPQEEINKYIENIANRLKVKKEDAERMVYYNILPKQLAQKTLDFLLKNAKVVIKENEKQEAQESKQEGE